MNKHRFLIPCFLLLTVLCLLTAGCDKAYQPPKGTRIAMISTPLDITDKGYNFISYEACRTVCEENSLPFRYYRAAEETTDSYLTTIDAAINDDYNVIVLNSSTAARAIRLAADANPDVLFLASDVAMNDFGTNYQPPQNLTAWNFEEAYAGFMAGYAAVKEGYRHLGFVGGIPVRAVLHFGYGFIQGADRAATELGEDVTLEYVYANQFFGDADVTAYMQNWYSNKGVEIVFACGGSVWTSVATAAEQKDGKVIGVDYDQKAQIDAYTGKDTTLTSAAKGLGESVELVLRDILAGQWEKYSGTCFTLSVSDKDHPEKNYLRLPLESWDMTRFTKEDYRQMICDIVDGKITVSHELTPPSTVRTTVHEHGSIK